MLVLSRKAFEQIKIGDDIVVEVRSISPSRVSIGIVAPPDTKILRGELEGKPRYNGPEVNDAE